MKILPLVAAGAMALAACGGGDDSPTQGTVSRHQYDDPDSSTVMMPVWSGKTVILVPQQQYDGAHWKIEVCNADKCKWVDVDPHTYDTLRDGDYYDSEASV